MPLRRNLSSKSASALPYAVDSLYATSCGTSDSERVVSMGWTVLDLYRNEKIDTEGVPGHDVWRTGRLTHYEGVSQDSSLWLIWISF
jgi:hypothetical protein